jgi:hypothetical protein
MKHRFHLTLASTNAKTGPIPVSTSSSSTCPSNCSLKDNGCYAESGPLRVHWNAIDSGTRGGTLDEFCNQIKALPKYQLWRWAQAGDLPGNGHLIDEKALKKIVKANKGRKGFGYTHYNPGRSHNADMILYANDEGFALNLSAETLEQADEFHAMDIAPVVVILPADQTEPTKTPNGVPVIVCPASLGKTTCALCAICANAERMSIVGFPAHGSGKAKAQKVFFATVSA